MTFFELVKSFIGTNVLFVTDLPTCCVPGARLCKSNRYLKKSSSGEPWCRECAAALQ